MLNIQSNINSILGVLGHQKLAMDRNKIAQEKNKLDEQRNAELKEARKAKEEARKAKEEARKANLPEAQVSRSQDTIAAFEKYVKGKRLTPDQENSLKKAVNSERLNYQKNMLKLINKDPSNDENIAKYFSGGISPNLQRRLQSIERKTQKSDIREIQDKDYRNRKNNILNQKTNFGRVKDLPKAVQTQILKSYNKGNKNGQK